MNKKAKYIGGQLHGTSGVVSLEFHTLERELDTPYSGVHLREIYVVDYYGRTLTFKGYRAIVKNNTGYTLITTNCQTIYDGTIESINKINDLIKSTKAIHRVYE